MKNLIIKLFPNLGKIKRKIFAYKDHILPVKNSYAQYGEDKFIYERLRDLDLSKGIFLDVGANHPSLISNTYLFYKKGYTGLVIEPNTQLFHLHKKFRKKDILLQVGCGNKCGLLGFNYYNIPVLGNFGDNIEEELRKHHNIPIKQMKKEYIPVLTLDHIINDLDIHWIYFLSIDVEGMDLEVLQGAIKILNKVYLICIENNNDDEKIKSLLNAHGFELLKKMGCNQIYANESNK